MAKNKNQTKKPKKTKEEIPIKPWVSMRGGMIIMTITSLALAVLVMLPLMFVSVRFFGNKQRVLSHHGMERQAEVTPALRDEAEARLPGSARMGIRSSRAHGRPRCIHHASLKTAILHACSTSSD